MKSALFSDQLGMGLFLGLRDCNLAQDIQLLEKVQQRAAKYIDIF